MERNAVNNKSSNSGLVPAIVAGLAGVLCFTLVPVLVMRAMDAVLRGAAVKIEASGNPLIASAPKIVIGFFPVWGGLTVAAGVALLLVAWAIYQGEKWAVPTAIGLLAVPSITGAYFSGPIMFFAKSNMPIFLVIALIGLIPYFFLLLSGKGSPAEKTGRFFLFLMLGVTAAWSFSNGGSSLRQFWARPEPMNILDSGNLGFLMGFPVVWIGVGSVVVSIPILAAHKRLGYRLGSVGLMIILVGSAILFIAHPGTGEFMAGIIMAVISLILLWLPGIGGKTVEG
jgi:hypothetical protein